MCAEGGSECQVIPYRSEGGVCWEIDPSGWEPTNQQKKTGPDGSGRNLIESDKTQKQGLIHKYVPMRLLRLYL